MNGGILKRLEAIEQALAGAETYAVIFTGSKPFDAPDIQAERFRLAHEGYTVILVKFIKDPKLSYEHDQPAQPNI